MQQSCFLKRGSLQFVGAGVELEDVGLFIDQNHSGLQKPAELKFGWGGELAELVLRVLYLAPECQFPVACNAMLMQA